MTAHSALPRLHDIRDAIKGIFETISGVTFQTYCDVWHTVERPNAGSRSFQKLAAMFLTG